MLDQGKDRNSLCLLNTLGQRRRLWCWQTDRRNCGCPSPATTHGQYSVFRSRSAPNPCHKLQNTHTHDHIATPLATCTDGNSVGVDRPPHLTCGLLERKLPFRCVDPNSDVSLEETTGFSRGCGRRTRKAVALDAESECGGLWLRIRRAPAAGFNIQ